MRFKFGPVEPQYQKRSSKNALASCALERLKSDHVRLQLAKRVAVKLLRQAVSRNT